MSTLAAALIRGVAAYQRRFTKTGMWCSHDRVFCQTAADGRRSTSTKDGRYKRPFLNCFPNMREVGKSNAWWVNCKLVQELTVMSNSNERNLRILVVDDFESMRKLVIRNLTQMGYLYQNIVQASNGQEALRLLETNSLIQLVITDWNMPVMTGIELLRAIRAHEQLRHLPVLMITAEIARQQVQEAAEAGVSAFLVKPFTVGGLQSKLTKVLSKKATGKVTVTVAEAMNDLAAAPFAAALFAKPPAATPKPVRSAALTESAPIHMPRAAGPSADEPPALILTPDLQARMAKQADILVVDDIADNIDVLAGLLQDEYKVRAAKSGEGALRMLSGSVLPDLILLDVMMPEMDGFEVCRRLKADARTAEIPVIFLTATDDAKNVVQGLELGAVDYVTKPADPIVLRTRVRNHLTRSKAFVELRRQYAVLEENARLREEVERITRHDLKNPIGGIINFTDMLLSDDMMTNDQKEMLQTISDSARSLLQMVNLSLDLYKIEQGTYELQPSRIELIALMRRILTEKAAEIGAKQLQVATTLRRSEDRKDEPLEFFITGDEVLCYSMFANLLKNAVEASPKGGKLTLTFEALPNDRSVVRIINGGAVPAEIRSAFFDKYATSGKTGGTGIGTYSAKLIAEAQDGSVDMETSDAASETTLTVNLPSG